MTDTAVQAKGVVRWVNRYGRMFGYIESHCGKEIYFDEASLAPAEGAEFSVGEAVAFLLVKHEFGDMAFKLRRV